MTTSKKKYKKPNPKLIFSRGAAPPSFPKGRKLERAGAAASLPSPVYIGRPPLPFDFLLPLNSQQTSTQPPPLPLSSPPAAPSSLHFPSLPLDLSFPLSAVHNPASPSHKSASPKHTDQTIFLLPLSSAKHHPHFHRLLLPLHPKPSSVNTANNPPPFGIPRSKPPPPPVSSRPARTQRRSQAWTSLLFQLFTGALYPQHRSSPQPQPLLS